MLATGGLVVALILVIAGGLLAWAHSFADSNVHTQLAAQKISFPAKGSPGLKADPEITKYVTSYAGQSVTSGAQAEVFANHYIAVHLRGIGQGKTYSEVSSDFLKMQPTDANYQKVAETRQTLFMGETLRGMLLNAYAFFAHRRRVSPDAEVFSKLVKSDELVTA